MAESKPESGSGTPFSRYIRARPRRRPSRRRPEAETEPASSRHIVSRHGHVHGRSRLALVRRLFVARRRRPPGQTASIRRLETEAEPKSTSSRRQFETEAVPESSARRWLGTEAASESTASARRRQTWAEPDLLPSPDKAEPTKTCHQLEMVATPDGSLSSHHRLGRMWQ